MAENRESQIRLQFLEEAQEYLDRIESDLLGLSSCKIEPQRLEAILRVLHSIKGSAAMMSFSILSDLAHRLEDGFKVLKTGKVEIIDEDLERLLLSSIDRIRQIVVLSRQENVIEKTWLETNVNPIFAELRDRLGEPQPEDEASLLSIDSIDAETEMRVLVFETEVEEYLQKLESRLSNPAMPDWQAELLTTAQELGGLGEMLKLPAFSSLCESIVKHLETTPEQIEIIFRSAIQAWRRSQAMVLAAQAEAISPQLELDNLDSAKSNSPQHHRTETELDTSFEFPNLSVERGQELDSKIESFLETDNLTQESLDWLDSIKEATLSGEEQQAAADNLVQERLIFDSEAIATPSSTPRSAQSKLDSLTKGCFESAQSTAEKINLNQKGQLNLKSDRNTADNTIRVSVGQLTCLNELLGELTVERNSLNLQLKRLRHLVDFLQQKTRVLEQSNFRLHSAYNRITTQLTTTPVTTVITKNSPTLLQENRYKEARESAGDTNITFDFNSQLERLETDYYSDLHPMSQEVMESIFQVQEVTNDIDINLEEVEDTAGALTRTSELMQTKLNQVRMRPLSELVERFPRALRNLELQYGKKVQLKVRGGSTLIDRTILEALKDPMLHLLRNAFAHGIEEPDERKASGKPEQGIIQINAAYRGDRIVIAISDDGRGIDLNKIRAKARQMVSNTPLGKQGLSAATSEELESMELSDSALATASDRDLLELIFEPGFSTAEQVTDIAGRGVGMDVVRTNLEQIEGTIKVDTKPGIGTTFTIAVPFTLSVIRILLIESNGMLLAFPSNLVEEMLVAQPETLSTRFGREFLNFEGWMIPLIRLDQCLNLPHFLQRLETEEVPSINQPTVLMIAQGDDLIGIQVDRYWREEEVTIRQVQGNIPLPPGFCGCTLLGDGRVVPLVDVLALVSWFDNHQQTTAPQLEPKPSLSATDSELQKRFPRGESRSRVESWERRARSIAKARVPNSFRNSEYHGRNEPSIASGKQESRIGESVSPTIPNPERSPSSGSKNSQKSTIMVVDDSINTRRFLALTLEKAGYRVEPAKDGQEALEKLEAGVLVQVVICDIEMPRLNGFGFLSQIKANPNYKHIPVIMLTSRRSDKHRRIGMNLGATAYLGKPFIEQELLKILKQLNQE